MKQRYLLVLSLLSLLSFFPLLGQDTLSFGGIYELPGAEVRATYTPVSPLAQSFTIEEVYRLPGTFYDPARLVALLPGVVQTNDQANHLSVRGNTPNANLWRINGLAIANPNHLSNAGTITDRPSLSGGGVNALSAQMLEKGNFYAGGLPLEYGFAPGGTFDLRLRPGNKEKTKFQAQAGFIGFDLAAEGPIGADGKTSFVANGRYSFTGLLADMGVDFGGEEIRFADLNLHLHRKTERGSISFFSILGASSNIFRHPEDEPVTIEKELFEIDLEGNTIINGLQATHQHNDRWTFNGGVAISRTKGERRSLRENGSARLYLLEFLQSDLQGSAIYAIDGDQSLKFGANWLTQRVDRGTNRTEKSTGAVALFGGYALGNKVSEVEVGVRLSNYNFVNSSVSNGGDFRSALLLEPRFSVKHKFNRKYVRAVIEGTRSAPIFTYLIDGKPNVPVTWQLALGYGRRLFGASVSAIVFGQYTPNENSSGGIHSASNYLEGLPFTFSNITKLHTLRYGVELEAAGGRLDQGIYYRGNLSLFSSQFDRARRGLQEGRYSMDFTSNLTIGREWQGKNRKDQFRKRGLNVAIVAHGGERYAEIVEGATYFVGTSFGGPFINDGDVYLRPDLRLYQTIEKVKSTTTLALDIQNVAGIENVGNVYYDAFLEAPTERLQLGLIPVLSYRVVWR